MMRNGCGNGTASATTSDTGSTSLLTLIPVGIHSRAQPRRFSGWIVARVKRMA